MTTIMYHNIVNYALAIISIGVVFDIVMNISRN